MHDILLAKEIFDMVIKYAKKNRLKKVKRIKIGLGQIEDHQEIIKPTNLRFNFQILASKKALTCSTKLVIRRINSPDWLLEEIEGE